MHRFKKDTKRNKNNRFCGHCHITGHTIDQCFKVHGYPKWYEGYKKKVRGNSRMAAHVFSQGLEVTQDTLLEEIGSSKLANEEVNSNLV